MLQLYVYTFSLYYHSPTWLTSFLADSTGHSSVEHFHFNLQKYPVVLSELYIWDEKYLPLAISKDKWTNFLRSCPQGMEFLKSRLTTLSSGSASPLLSLEQQQQQQKSPRRKIRNTIWKPLLTSLLFKEQALFSLEGNCNFQPLPIDTFFEWKPCIWF